MNCLCCELSLQLPPLPTYRHYQASSPARTCCKVLATLLQLLQVVLFPIMINLRERICVPSSQYRDSPYLEPHKLCWIKEDLCFLAGFGD